MVDRGTIVFNKANGKYYLSLGVSVFEKDSFELLHLYNVTVTTMTSKSLVTAYILLGADCKKQYWKRSAEIFGQVYYDLGVTYDSSVFNQPFDENKVLALGSMSLFYFKLSKDVSDKIDEEVIDTWLLKNKIMGKEIPECENLENSLNRNKETIDTYKWNFNQTKRIMVDIIFRYLKEMNVLPVEMYEKEDNLYYVSYRSRVILDVVGTKMTKTKKLTHYVYALLLHLCESQLKIQETFHAEYGVKVVNVEDFQ